MTENCCYHRYIKLDFDVQFYSNNANWLLEDTIDELFGAIFIYVVLAREIKRT